MNNYDILKNLKSSYENIQSILRDSNIIKSQTYNLQIVLELIKKIYDSTYLSTLNNDKSALQTNAYCKNCNSCLLISDNIDYSYLCEECDENFYEFEVINDKKIDKPISKKDEKFNSSFYFNKKISFVDEKIVNDYLNNWFNNKKQNFNGNKLYCKKNNKFVAIDNSTGDCWVEEFKSEKEAKDWLLRKDLKKEDEYEI